MPRAMHRAKRGAGETGKGSIYHLLPEISQEQREECEGAACVLNVRGH